MAIIDHYSSTEAGAPRVVEKDRTARSDEQAFGYMQRMLEDLGVTEQMIGYMNEEEAQEIIMATDDDREELLAQIESECQERERQVQETGVRRIGNTVVQCAERNQ